MNELLKQKLNDIKDQRISFTTLSAWATKKGIVEEVKRSIEENKDNFVFFRC